MELSSSGDDGARTRTRARAARAARATRAARAARAGAGVGAGAGAGAGYWLITDQFKVNVSFSSTSEELSLP